LTQNPHAVVDHVGFVVDDEHTGPYGAADYTSRSRDTR
jgi:hypothetical protein